MTTLVKSDDYQMLILANDLFPAIREGGKRVTLRKDRRSLELDKLLFISTDPVGVIEERDTYCERGGTVYMSQLVTVTEIRYKRFRDITNKEAQADGFVNTEAAFEGMKRFYPSLDPSSVMTIVYFEVLGR